jgi:hypothetical protein
MMDNRQPEGDTAPKRQRVPRLGIRERQSLYRVHARRERKKCYSHRLARSRS